MSSFLLMRSIILLGLVAPKGLLMLLIFLKPYLARKRSNDYWCNNDRRIFPAFWKGSSNESTFSVITLKENTKRRNIRNFTEKLNYFIEQFHQIWKSDNEVLTYLVDNVDRYIKNRTFPDKAIDIFDLACVKARFKQQHIITKQIVKML